MDTQDLKACRKAFSDISRGYTYTLYKNDKAYIKHTCHHDQVDLDVVYDKYYQSALSRDIPTQEERLNFLIQEENSWSKEEEQKLKELSEFTQSLIQAKSRLFLKKQIDEQNERIEANQKEYAKLLSQKTALIGVTCESYAERKVNEFYILNSFYKDKKFEEPLISSEQYNDFSNEDVNRLVVLYNLETKPLNDENIKKTALEPFFQQYVSLCSDNIYSFYGIPVCDLTFFQINLYTYGCVFLNILNEHKNIPEDIKKDPNKLLDYAKANESAKKIKEKMADKDGSSIVGGTKEDYAHLGINTEDSLNLSKELQKSGKKSLSMREIIEKMGG